MNPKSRNVVKSDRVRITPSQAERLNIPKDTLGTVVGITPEGMVSVRWDFATEKSQYAYFQSNRTKAYELIEDDAMDEWKDDLILES